MRSIIFIAPFLCINCSGGDTVTNYVPADGTGGSSDATMTSATGGNAASAGGSQATGGSSVTGGEATVATCKVGSLGCACLTESGPTCPFGTSLACYNGVCLGK